MLEIFFKMLNTEETPITQNSIANSICELDYHPDEEITFPHIIGFMRTYFDKIVWDGQTTEKFAFCCEN